MAGFANSPFAITPFGTGTPVVAQAPPENAPDGARYLNPASRDYEQGDDGEYLRMPSTRQRVLLAVMTELGSMSVAPNDGLRLPKKMNEHFERKAAIEVRRVLQPMIREGALRLDAVTTVERVSTGRARIRIDFTDLATRQRDSLVF